MIEAVNSVVANNTILRASSAQVDASASAAPIPAPTKTGEAPQAPQAPFVSPYIALDTESNRAVLQIRDGETGDVQQQFPTESRLVQIQEAQARAQLREARTSSVSQNAEISSPTGSEDVVTVDNVTSSQPSNTASAATSAQTALPSVSATPQPSTETQSSTVSVLA